MACRCLPKKNSCRQCASSVPNTTVELCGSNTLVKEINRVTGINTAVVDDANELTYFYGNIQHENFHVASDECQPYVVVPTSWQTYRQILTKTEVFEGVFPLNTIVLAETPTDMRQMFVFLNGLHMDEGQEYDYQLNGKSIVFTHHQLIASDRVTVKYHFEGASV